MGARTRAVAAVAVAVGCQLAAFGQQPAPGSPLPTPVFHHLHLNSVNPDRFAGQPALTSPNSVLQGENVTILEPPYTIGTARAFMIEGPSKEAIELIAVK